jgi:hypothetical protein
MWRLLTESTSFGSNLHVQYFTHINPWDRAKRKTEDLSIELGPVGSRTESQTAYNRDKKDEKDTCDTQAAVRMTVIDLRADACLAYQCYRDTDAAKEERLDPTDAIDDEEDEE